MLLWCRLFYYFYVLSIVIDTTDSILTWLVVKCQIIDVLFLCQVCLVTFRQTDSYVITILMNNCSNCNNVGCWTVGLLLYFPNFMQLCIIPQCLLCLGSS